MKKRDDANQRMRRRLQDAAESGDSARIEAEVRHAFGRVQWVPDDRTRRVLAEVIAAEMLRACVADEPVRMARLLDGAERHRWRMDVVRIVLFEFGRAAARLAAQDAVRVYSAVREWLVETRRMPSAMGASVEFAVIELCVQGGLDAGAECDAIANECRSEQVKHVVECVAAHVAEKFA